MSSIPVLVTEEDFLAMPDVEGIERDLVRGELRERPESIRTYAHSILSGRIGYLLGLWLRTLPRPRGVVLIGPAARLLRDPITIVGMDLAYIAAEAIPSQPHEAQYVDGPPILVIEILSPNDTCELIADKIEEYLEAGVLIVWIVEPRFSTVTVYRPDAKPQLFNSDQELTAEPHLPGFRVAVADLFQDLD